MSLILPTVYLQLIEVKHRIELGPKKERLKHLMLLALIETFKYLHYVSLPVVLSIQAVKDYKPFRNRYWMTNEQDYLL